MPAPTPEKDVEGLGQATMSGLARATQLASEKLDALVEKAHPEDAKALQEIFFQVTMGNVEIRGFRIQRQDDACWDSQTTVLRTLAGVVRIEERSFYPSRGGGGYEYSTLSLKPSADVKLSELAGENREVGEFGKALVAVIEERSPSL